MEKKTIKITIGTDPETHQSTANLVIENEGIRNRLPYKETEPGISGQRTKNIDNSLARVIDAAATDKNCTVLVNGINAKDLKILMEPGDRPVNSLGDKFLNWLKTYDSTRRQAKADRLEKKV